MLPQDTYALTKKENRRIFTEEIAPIHLGKGKPVALPELHCFGAQPGAGKSVAISSALRDIQQRLGHDSVVAIIGDEYRSFHPLYNSLLVQDDTLAAYYTDIDSGRWVEQAIEYAAKLGKCVVLEGTLRNPQTTLDTVSHYLAAGFKAHLHIIAVHEYVSRLRIFMRYFGQVASEGFGRYTVPEAHGRAYHILSNSTEALVKSGQFETVTVYDAHNSILTSLPCGSAGTIAALGSTLNSVRSGTDLDVGELLKSTDIYLQTARKQGKDTVIADLLALRKDLEDWT
jgi:predicted ABC-type ATPase